MNKQTKQNCLLTQKTKTNLTNPPILPRRWRPPRSSSLRTTFVFAFHFCREWNVAEISPDFDSSIRRRRSCCHCYCCCCCSVESCRCRLQLSMRAGRWQLVCPSRRNRPRRCHRPKLQTGLCARSDWLNLTENFFWRSNVARMATTRGLTVHCHHCR